ncbi:MAG: cation transporting ATPase C-terminal domain-containing protein [Fibrobacterota bacterium]|nr:cation transporting ATPase C-terminal domain-containing protein [Fibrobacterota bacterium]
MSFRYYFRFQPVAVEKPILFIGTLDALLLHLAMGYAPFDQNLLGRGPVSLGTWALRVLLALVILVVMDIHKWIWRRYRA